MCDMEQTEKSELFIADISCLSSLQPDFARCSAVSWAATLYTHFRGFLPLTALLHGTPAAAGVSQTLRRGTMNGITEVSQRAPPTFGWTAITFGIGPLSS